MLRLRKLSAILTLAVLVTSCSDQAGPRVDDAATLAKGGRWATIDVTDGTTGTPETGETTCIGNATASDAPPCTLRHRADAPPLMAYDTSFTVVQGERAEFVLHYVDPGADATSDGWGSLGTWFMRLSVPRDAQMLDADGRPLANGDTVEVTVTVDPELFHAEFTPHGSIFEGKKPALLEFSLEHAAVGALDPAATLVWYRDQAGSEWSSLQTAFDLRGMKVQAPIYHFSGYAVAW